jgi:hypothetical protein
MRKSRCLCLSSSQRIPSGPTTGIGIRHSTNDHHGSLGTTVVDPSHSCAPSPDDRGGGDGGPIALVEIHSMKHTIVGTRARHSTKDDQTGFVGRHGHTGESVRRQAVVCAQRESRHGRVELWVRTEFSELFAGTYGKDQNIIGDLIVCGRDLSTDNVHGRLRWHIDSLMPPSSGRVQPKRYRDQSQCRKKNWLHR